MAVLNDVRMFGAVKDRNRTSVALGSNVVVGWVNGYGGDVDAQVTRKHHTCALSPGQESNSRGKISGQKRPSATQTTSFFGSISVDMTFI